MRSVIFIVAILFHASSFAQRNNPNWVRVQDLKQTRRLVKVTIPLTKESCRYMYFNPRIAIGPSRDDIETCLLGARFHRQLQRLGVIEILDGHVTGYPFLTLKKDGSSGSVAGMLDGESVDLQLVYSITNGNPQNSRVSEIIEKSNNNATIEFTGLVIGDCK